MSSSCKKSVLKRTEAKRSEAAFNLRHEPDKKMVQGGSVGNEENREER